MKHQAMGQPLLLDPVTELIIMITILASSVMSTRSSGKLNEFGYEICDPLKTCHCACMGCAVGTLFGISRKGYNEQLPSNMNSCYK